VLTFEQIKELIELVGRHGLAGVEVERAGFRLKIAGLPASPPAAPASGAAAPYVLAVSHGVEAGATSAPAGVASPAGAAGAGAPAARHAGGAAVAGAPPGAAQPHILDSPIVGTFYRSPSPDAPPFVEAGSRVKRGQVVCIIEAMKLMNEIESDVDGTIAEIYPQNAQAVAFGDPLFAIVET
jgi:acetyl-CoA carboxylase biotin carboxyl carrier protein